MKKDDPGLIAWSQERREARQQVDASEVVGRIDGSTGELIPGWIGLRCSSENNQTGRSELVVDLRPVLRGRIEMSVQVETRAIDATRSHKKHVYLAPTTKALREFAQGLLMVADEADVRAKASGPKLVT
ncbi:MAG: hypothetical protein QM608_22075 [Caulobacter sp.]